MLPGGPGRKWAPRLSGGSDSGRKNSAALKFASDSVAAKNAGAEYPQWLRKPPMAGPKMKPRPKAAPTNPMPLARFSGVVESAMNACAVGMFAPAIPARMRAANSIASESARPKAR